MSETNPPGPQPSEEHHRRFDPKKPWVVLTMSALLALLSFFALRYLVHARAHVSTDDAFIEADVVSIAPRVAGEASHVYIDDNQFVRAGDLLVEIDPRDYQAQLKERKAALEAARTMVPSAESSLQQTHSQVRSAEAQAAQRQAEVTAEAAIAARAETDLKRSRELLANKTISPQEFDAASAAARNARASLDAARQHAASADSDLEAARNQVSAAEAAVARAKAQVLQAQADLQTAELNLSYTTIRSPETGWVTRKSVEPGTYLQVGQVILAIVPTNLWVIANFKETQLHHMRAGQPVRIKVDAYPGNPSTGHVDSIQAGSGARFSLLPPENAVGNFVKVVQRVPVKILFDQPLNPAHVFGPGMSVVPSVTIRNISLHTWRIALIAAVIGVVAAGLGLRWAAVKH